MKYLILDTNIILDMIIDRRNNVSKDLVESFIKLLNFDEIKLVVPSIVKHETYKHLEEQLEEVRKKLDNAIKAVEQIYGINGYTIQGLDVKSYKDNASKALKELNETYKNSRSQYLEEIKTLVATIFEHKNSITIPDSDTLNNSCLKRRIYKKAPFHIERKESYADGLIIEILLSMGSLVEITDEDKVIFVTGNTSDFSDNQKKDSLHIDILNDLQSSGISDKVVYVTKFNLLIGKILKAEVESAKLTEEFEKDLREEEENDQLMLDSEIEDYERESAGLSSLGSFENDFIQSFSESEFAEQIISLFERLNHCYHKAEELYAFYADDLPDYLSNSALNKSTEIVTLWNSAHSNMPACSVSDNITGLLNIFELIEEKESEYLFLSSLNQLQDYLSYGEPICFYGKDSEKYTLAMDKLYLTCDSGESDQLDITILENDSDIIARGHIDITYGFAEFDDDGNIADACEESIEYSTCNITDIISNLVKKFEDYINSEFELIEQLAEKFEL